MSVGFDLHTGTQEWIEYFVYEDGSIGPLPPGTSYFTYTLSEEQRDRVTEILAKILVRSTLDEMARAGKLSEAAKRRVECVSETESGKAVGSLRQRASETRSPKAPRR